MRRILRSLFSYFVSERETCDFCIDVLEEENVFISDFERLSIPHKKTSFTFSKSGFSLPIFGINLKNDLEFSFSYTASRNATIIYLMDDFNEKGKPQDGTLRTTLEPRVKYIMSSRITLSIFYRRTKVKPEGASRIPPTTTNEAGLDVHIAIQ